MLQYLRHAGQHLEPCKIYLQTAKPHPTATNLPTSLEQGKTQGRLGRGPNSAGTGQRSAATCPGEFASDMRSFHGLGGAGDGKHGIFVSQTESKFQEHDEGWSLIHWFQQQMQNTASTLTLAPHQSFWPRRESMGRTCYANNDSCMQIKATQEFAAWCSPSLTCKDLLPGTSWHPVMLSGPFCQCNLHLAVAHSTKLPRSNQRSRQNVPWPVHCTAMMACTVYS